MGAFSWFKRLFVVVAATIVGSILGGPIGAAIGASIGGVLANKLFPFSVKQGQGTYVGNRLDELNTISSEYGHTIPIIYGTTRVGGVIIWADRLDEQKRNKTQNNTKYTWYDYYANFSVALAYIPEGSNMKYTVSKIISNGEVLYDLKTGVSKATKPVGEGVGEGDIVSNVVVYDGNQTAADPKMLLGTKISLGAGKKRIRHWYHSSIAKAITVEEGYIFGQRRYSIKYVEVQSANAAHYNFINRLKGQLAAFDWVNASADNRGRGRWGPWYIYNYEKFVTATLSRKSPAYKGICYIRIENMNLRDYGGQIPNLLFEITGTLSSVKIKPSNIQSSNTYTSKLVSGM